MDNRDVGNPFAYPQPLTRLATLAPPVENRVAGLTPASGHLCLRVLSTEIGFTIHIHFNSPLKPFDLLILFTRSPVSACWLEIDLYRGFL